MNTRTHLTMLGLLAAAGLAIVGCDQSGSPSSGGSSPTPSTAPAPKTPPPPAPDNSGRNKADRNTDAKTPLDQGQNSADIKITADIRKAIMDEPSMSVNARNCKIITEGGRVTLRGVVDSQAEKDAIEAKAKAFAGVDRVDNQLEVKTK